MTALTVGCGAEFVILGDAVDQIQTAAVESVVHVITDAGPHPYLRTLIEAGGLEPTTLAVGCIGPAGALQEEISSLGVSTFALGAMDRSGYPRAVVRLARLLRRHRAQLLQTHLLDGSVVGLLAGRLARTPVTVMTAHHSHELPFHGRRLLWPERLCAIALCDHIIAPSRAVADTLVRCAHVPESKVEIVHHGFDFARLDPRAVDGGRVRKELGLEGATVFGAIGRIYRLKNYMALLDAFAAALRDRHEARLVIVGPGDATALMARVAALGIGGSVVFTGPRNDVPELLAAFDAFVHPAVAESFGMVIVEAMAMGLPVLTTPVGIACELIKGRASGLVSTGSDSLALERGLLELLELRPRWPEMGAAARRQVEGLTAERMAGRYCELYQTWLGAPRRGAATPAWRP
jgi:glycosyltransferase involved in cell wall biosynthesis